MALPISLVLTRWFLFWTSVNQTSTVAQESSYAFDKETVYQYTYSGESITLAMLYKVENGNHGWFDHEIRGQSFTYLIWDFLSTQILVGAKINFDCSA